MMLPGVELARRRRLHHRNDSYLRGPSEPSPAAQPQPIDQPAAAAARRRLEEKLRRPFAVSRSPSSSPSISSPFPRWMRTSTTTVQDNSRQVHASHENRGTGKRGGELSRKSSRVDICAVCLDGFRVQQQVMWLPCAHRYHSSCVLPWLADHSHCPYCRTEVPSLELLSDSVL
ncbi:hypothetical protein IEQ34_006997 [Dendrobium chrysotoxum]|uniref:RING-type domain-containing protein n=1 Tax=Dendrobium chrysotoxum TaxID=161865 RepID=A0AAV7H6M2_DENCH|nr:hypothetical protein IEQ34_006997 [Dendrobium chrysotoxum]